MVIAVIGRGMIGSAAARHLALMGQDVLLIGPDEPRDYASHTGVFASHYDEARITRALDPYPFWSRVSRQSIARYSEIERDSGFSFFTSGGLAMAGPEGTPYLAKAERGAVRDNIHFETYRSLSLKRRFPYFSFPDHSVCLFEPLNAGHINPRALVQAQGIAAQKQGAHVITATVTGLQETADGVEIDSTAGHLSADQVLVAAGGFTNGILDDPLPLRTYARTILLAEVGPEEQQRLKDMPPLIWVDAEKDPYLLPAVTYPDGRTYLKIGGDKEDVLLETEDDRRAWFRSGGSVEVGQYLTEVLHELVTDLKVETVQIAPCLTTFTDRAAPTIRRLGNRISVATGGSGKAAKCSDELGRLGALVATNTPLPDWAAEVLA